MFSERSDRERGDEEALGEILREVLERKQAGEHPTAGEFTARYPHLRERIEGHFRMMGLLDGLRESGGSATGDSLGEAISALPEPIQRAIFLRHCERFPWSRIARTLGEPEEKIRRGYSRAVRQLIARCSGDRGD